MEKILSKKLTLVVALLLASLGLSTAAQTATTARPYTKTQWVNGVPYQVTSLPGSESKMKQFIKANDQQAPQPKKRAAKEDAQMVNVNIQFVEHDDIEGYPSGVMAFSEEGKENASLSMGENELETGVYTFRAIFYKLTADREYIDYYVFKESIPVYEDLTLTFDADEAKNFVQTKIIGSDGNEVQMYHEIEGQGLVGGECVLGGFAPFVKEGFGYSFGGNFDGAGVWQCYNFYISDVDDIALNFSIYFDKNDIIHTVNFYQKGVHEDVVFENDPNDYVEQEIEYKETPLGVGSPHYPIVNNSSCDGASFGHIIFRDVSDGKMTYRFGKSLFDPTFPIRIDLGLTDYAYINEWTEEEDYTTTRSLPIFNIDGELRVVNSGFTSYDPTHMRLIDIDGETLLMNGFQYPGHPAFSYPVAQKSPEALNNSCPFMRTYAYVYVGDEIAMIQGMTCSLGRFGEKRESDTKTITRVVKFGETTETVIGPDFFVFSQDPNSGSLEATLTNENVDVDGISGKNVSQIYVDMTRDDKAFPTLTMLHFRNNDGLVTDRFATSDNGSIELSAGDIYEYPNWEENTIHTSVGKVTVEVAYSPYGEDNWNEIAVEEDPSLFYLPDMGNFFRGSLEGVTGQAYEGWFDLKVKVTDAAGNWQEQVISPAFRIDNLAYSSVATVGNENAREVARYNLAGQRVDGDAKGVVIVKMSDGTARKVIL